MNRLVYRNFGDHEALLISHAVTAGTGGGVRFYELRLNGACTATNCATPTIFQQGTFAPDASFRWMSSMAFDQVGNIAMGYTTSSSTINPSIRYTGRLTTDALGTMGQGEATLIAGTGSQTGNNLSRWGDYSSMNIDPSDDCTFWYTQEYYSADSPYSWQTRIGAFKFDACGTCPLVGAPVLTVDRWPSGISLSWTASANADRYEVVEGGLAALISSGGNYAASMSGCLGGGLTATSLEVDEPDPSPGGGSWYLVRGTRGSCRGTFGDGGVSGAAARDAGIGSASSACP
ncbi:MAG: hypothetical protein LAO51_14405 [Acidobacteriia bacterium]|nr:hypothetical protein [Terriglobia bacterium]